MTLVKLLDLFASAKTCLPAVGNYSQLMISMGKRNIMGCVLLSIYKMVYPKLCVDFYIFGIFLCEPMNSIVGKSFVIMLERHNGNSTCLMGL